MSAAHDHETEHHGDESAHAHEHAAHHGHSHGHEHADGGWSRIAHFFVPHTHDPSDSIDDALTANREGVQALRIGLIVLLATTVLQGAVFIASGSIALLADTIHNLSDALTAIPLWIAFTLSRRPATRRFRYGLGRAEDLAGIVIVLAIAASSIVALWEAIDRIVHPRPVENLWWVAAAGVIGFLGNEIVAVYRIRVGQRIGSAALVADGVHARTDGFTSLAVVLGAIGVMLGWPLADPIVGIVIAAVILVLLIGTVRSVGRRLLDGIEPEVAHELEHALEHCAAEGVRVDEWRLRWVGHRLQGTARISVATTSLAEASATAAGVEATVRAHLPQVDVFTVTPVPAAGTAPTTGVR